MLMDDDFPREFPDKNYWILVDRQERPIKRETFLVWTYGGNKQQRYN